MPGTESTAAKRRRAADDQQSRENTIGAADMQTTSKTNPISRIAVLEFTNSLPQFSSSKNVITVWLFEDILRMIPHYRTLLDRRRGDDELAIEDKTPRNPTHMRKTFRFLMEAYLPPLDASAPLASIETTLQSLIGMYDISLALELEVMEHAILSHIDSFPGLMIGTFRKFAVDYYADRTHTKDTSMGKLIKKKLAELLPRIIEMGAIAELQKEGGCMNEQLVEVLVERVQGTGRTAQGGGPDGQPNVIKLEDDA